MTRAAMYRLACVLGALALVSGCVGSTGSGPVHAALDFGFSSVDVGSYPNVPIEWDVSIVNDTGHRVRITGARLVDLPSFAHARLAHVERITGKNRVGVVRGWPDKDIETKPLLGAMVPPGRADLVLAISGPRSGVNYGAAGVELTWKDGAETGTATGWGVGVVCVNGKAAACPKHVQRGIDARLDWLHTQAT